MNEALHPAAPALVLLAAGASSRLGEPKALVRTRSGNVLGDLLVAGRDWTPPDALVVTGAHHAQIAASLAQVHGIELAFNERWADGRSGSVRVAREQRAGRDLCLAPVDVPRVERAVFASLRARWIDAGSPPLGWLAPFFSDRARRFGHPVVIGRDLLRTLDELGPGMPLHLLRQRADPLLALEVHSASILDDLDTPDDRREILG